MGENNADNNSTLVEDCFGVLKREGCPSELVRRFTISNGKISVQVITYGATITSIKVPDKEGNVDDIVLGFDDLKGYLNHPYYFGCTVGRVANRIAKGNFKLLSSEYQLNTNAGGDHLHGGYKGFDKVLWDSHVEGKTVTFSYMSLPWEEGYPGAVDCQVMYELTEENNLIIRYKATPSQTTPINLTNHSYFNLGGHACGTVHDHLIALNARTYTPLDKNLIPTGEILPVENTIYDLRKPVCLGSVLSQAPDNGIDLNYCIYGDIGTLRRVGRAYHPKSGRILEVLTTQPGVQLYTGNFLPVDNTLRGKGDAYYKRHSGLCLETQGYPNSVNLPNFPSYVVEAGETYDHTTIYHFFTE